MKREKTVIVFSEEQYDGEWPPEDALGYIAWFAGKLEKIPLEYQATATIEIDSVGGYEDSHYARIQIYYDRPETDEEMAEREAEEQHRKEARKERELRMLAELKAKYDIS